MARVARKTRSSMTKSPSKRKRLDSTNVVKLDSTKLDSPPVRVKMLAEAQHLVGIERNGEYGEPGENMGRTAAMLRGYLGNRSGQDIAAQDVAAFGIILKLGRVAHNPNSLDNWRDVAGYAAIAFEIMEAQQPKKRGRPRK